MKKLIFILTLCLLISFWPQMGQATVFYAHNFNAGQSYLMFWENHGYYARSMNFQYAYEIFNFEKMRQDLVADRLINDLPLLIVLPSSISADYPEKSTLSINENCRLLSGEEGIEQKKDIGKCYNIVMTSGSYEDIILAILELQNLPDNKTLTIDFSQLKEKFKEDMARYLNIENAFDIIWSPDGKYVTYIKTQAGQSTVKVVQVSNNKEIFSEKLPSYQNNKGLWSPDSQYLAYATGEGIKLFNLRTYTIKSINFTDYIGGSTMFVNLKFSDFKYTEPALIFQIEKDSFGQFLLYGYDLNTDKLNPMETDDFDLAWDYNFWDYNLREADISNVGKISPDGMKLAQIYIEDGMRKFKIEDVVSKKAEQNVNADNLANINQVSETGQQNTSITDIVPIYTILIVIFGTIGLALILLVIVIIKVFKK